MSYSTFTRLMSGHPANEEHAGMMARSLLSVRQELRRQNICPLMECLGKKLTELLRTHFADDGGEVFTAQELSDLRRILRSGGRRHHGTS